MTNRTHYAYTASATAVFVELPAFERCRARYLDDEAFTALQYLLMRNPVAGNLIQETADCANSASPTPGEARAGAVGFVSCITGGSLGSESWLFTLFGKDEMADLRPHERPAPKAMVEAELEIKRNL